MTTAVSKKFPLLRLTAIQIEKLSLKMLKFACFVLGITDLAVIIDCWEFSIPDSQFSTSSVSISISLHMTTNEKGDEDLLILAALFCSRTVPRRDSCTLDAHSISHRYQSQRYRLHHCISLELLQLFIKRRLRYR